MKLVAIRDNKIVEIEQPEPDRVGVVISYHGINTWLKFVVDVNTGDLGVVKDDHKTVDDWTNAHEYGLHTVGHEVHQEAMEWIKNHADEINESQNNEHREEDP